MAFRRKDCFTHFPPHRSAQDSFLPTSSCARIGMHKMAEYCVLNNIVHILDVKKRKDLGCCRGFYGSELVLRKNTLTIKVVLEGNCNSPQELGIVVMMSKTLRRDVYKCDFPFCFLPTPLIRILFWILQKADSWVVAPCLSEQGGRFEVCCVLCIIVP